MKKDNNLSKRYKIVSEISNELYKTSTFYMLCRC